jgi:quercetin dioxygenase-like cupin family protein
MTRKQSLKGAAERVAYDRIGASTGDQVSPPLGDSDQETTVNATRVTILALALTGIVAAAGAQQPTFKRTVLQQGDLSVAGHEAVMAVAEFQPGAAVGRHTHPGEEISYVLEGKMLIEQDGKAPVTLEAGKVFMIPAGTVHNATNSGPANARVLATYVVEKGKPVSTPAAAK